MRLIHYLLILLATFLSPNYNAAPPTEPLRVVTKIDVTVIHDAQVSTASYTDNTQMKSILTYLRMTEPKGAMFFDPDSFRSDSFIFTIYFSDGSQTVYRQIYHDFLQKNHGRWQKLSPKADLHFPPL